MSKKKRSSQNTMSRSDIPYSQRLLMQKHQTIAAHRDDAALTACKISMVALNDTEGLGYLRLSRFAKRHEELIREYYADPELESAHLDERLRQIGFLVEDGHVFAATSEATGEYVPVKTLKEEQDDEQ